MRSAPTKPQFGGIFKFKQMQQNLLQDILSADNTARTRAEQEFEKQRTADPATLLQLFLGNLSNADESLAQMSCVLFKKYFLDNGDAE